ncbi:MAG: Hsp20/alpha crystallin family protein [Bacteroidetes bacterium]|nr:MAG: Hsp20/alpha crystallin family protein [Bacteroidota bacterium]
MTLVKFRPALAKDFFRDTLIPSHVMGIIDNVFNDTTAKFERNVFFTPRVDVLEKSASFELHVSLPGLSKDQINVDVNKNQLTISGERKAIEVKEGERFHLNESYYGKFSRTFTLPENVNKDAVEASFEHGILTVSLPKTEAKEVRNSIKIK